MGQVIDAKQMFLVKQRETQEARAAGMAVFLYGVSQALPIRQPTVEHWYDELLKGYDPDTD